MRVVDSKGVTRHYFVLRWRNGMMWEGPYECGSAREAITEFINVPRTGIGDGPRIVKVGASGELIEFTIKKGMVIS